LWRISGKGMAKPSFLFGTMHVEDKRVFHFSDSVMLAIQSCPRFALEVQPDSVMSELFNLMSSTDETDLKKMLSDDEYRKLEKKFKEKNGYSIGKTNPMLLESLMQPKDRHPDDMQSFVDAYLYGIARTLNKKIYGLEDAASQIEKYFGSPEAIGMRLRGILDDDEQLYAKRSKEEMVKIYSGGDIDKVYDYIRGTAAMDSVIMERNKVMASSIIKNMNEEPIFSAVGAAHLPGPGGVIALLQKEGYNVTPVKATFTGVADTFRIDYQKLNWPAFSDNEKGYSVSFPGKPMPIKISGIPYQIYTDIGNGLSFGCYVVHKGTPGQPMTAKEAFASTESIFAARQNNIIVSEKQFLYRDYPCAEVLLKNNNRYLRLRLVFANNLMYHFYVGSIHGQLDQPTVDRYFNSVSISVVAQKPPAPWNTYTDKTAAFSTKFPFAPTITHKTDPSVSGEDSVNYIINYYSSTDTVNSRSYLVQYYDYPAGTYLADKKEALLGYVKDFEEKGTPVGKPLNISNNGVDGVEARFILNGGFETTIRTYVKGNRVYLLLKEILQSGLKDGGQTDPFFDSFQLLPSAEADGYTLESAGANYKIQLPAKPLLKPEKRKIYNGYLIQTGQYVSNNPNSGALYDFECLKISPYYNPGNADSIFKNKAISYTGYGDTLLKLDTVKVNGITGRELLVMDTASKVKRRIRMFIDGENYFYLSARADESELHNKTTETFFNSLTLTSPSKAIDLASPKAEIICRDMSSPDTTVSKRALGAISYYDFKPGDLHYIYDALKKSYPDDTSEYSVRVNLVGKLRSIGNDTSQSFLAGLYSELEGKDELKATILEDIPFLNKKTGFDIYIRLLTTDPPLKARNVYKAFIPLSDSVEFAAKHFEQLMQFVKYDKLRGRVLSVAREIAADKNKDDKKMIGDNYLKLMAYAGADIDSYLKTKDSVDNDYAGAVYSYMSLMKDFKYKELNARLTSVYLEKDPNGTYSPEAVVARIYNGLPNKPAIVKHLMDSLDTRYDLMEAYYDQKQPEKIPELYRRQDQYASLCLFKYIRTDGEDDDGGTATDMKLLGAITRGEKIYYAFKFSLAGDDDNKVMIGIAGPYKPGSTKLNFDKYFAYSAYETLKSDWRTQASAMIKPLLDTYK
jgi:uncharacterized protein YbaP (TraB family)